MSATAALPNWPYHHRSRSVAAVRRPVGLAVDEVLAGALAADAEHQPGFLERDAGLVGQCPEVASCVLTEAEHERVARQGAVGEMLDARRAVVRVAVVAFEQDEDLAHTVAEAARVVAEHVPASYCLQLPVLRLLRGSAEDEAPDPGGPLVVVVLPHGVNHVRRAARGVREYEPVRRGVRQLVLERVEAERPLLEMPAEVGEDLWRRALCRAQRRPGEIVLGDVVDLLEMVLPNVREPDVARSAQVGAVRRRAPGVAQTEREEPELGRRRDVVAGGHDDVVDGQGVEAEDLAPRRVPVLAVAEAIGRRRLRAGPVPERGLQAEAGLQVLVVGASAVAGRQVEQSPVTGARAEEDRAPVVVELRPADARDDADRLRKRRLGLIGRRVVTAARERRVDRRPRERVGGLPLDEHVEVILRGQVGVRAGLLGGHGVELAEARRAGHLVVRMERDAEEAPLVKRPWPKGAQRDHRALYSRVDEQSLCTGPRVNRPERAVLVNDIQYVRLGVGGGWVAGDRARRVRAVQRRREAGPRRLLLQLRSDRALLDVPRDRVLDGLGGVLRECGRRRGERRRGQRRKGKEEAPHCALSSGVGGQSALPRSASPVSAAGAGSTGCDSGDRAATIAPSSRPAWRRQTTTSSTSPQAGLLLVSG